MTYNCLRKRAAPGPASKSKIAADKSNRHSNSFGVQIMGNLQKVDVDRTEWVPETIISHFVKKYVSLRKENIFGGGSSKSVLCGVWRNGLCRFAIYGGCVWRAVLSISCQLIAFSDAQITVCKNPALCSGSCFNKCPIFRAVVFQNLYPSPVFQRANDACITVGV